MRVLLISHTCQSRTEGQPKAVCLAAFPDVEIRVLVPQRWRHYGAWRSAEVPATRTFAFEIGSVAWPWIPGAQSYLHWYPALGRLLNEFRPDVIDLWEEPWSLVSYQAFQLRKKLLPAVKVISETEQNINKRLPFPFEAFRTYTLRNADYVIGRNAAAIDVVRAKGYSGPASVVPNAIDPDLFRPMDKAACRSALGLTGCVAGYVGRLVEEKGLMDIIDALAYCPDHVNVLFVGSGDFQATLERRASAMGKSRQVRFIPGQPLQQLPGIMNAIDMLVLPSHTTPRWKEQFGRVIIEANACGTPVVGSDSGAIPEVIGKAGIIVPERSPEALAKALIDLDCNPDLRAELGRIGREQVAANYTWERVARQMRDVYLHCVEA